MKGWLKVSGRRVPHLFRVLSAIALLIAVSGPAVAADSESSDQWKFSIEPYLWGISVGGETSAGDDIDLPLSDLLDDLELAAMLTMGARKGKWSLLADIVYFDISDDQTSTANIIGRSIATEVEVEITGWVVTLAGGYTIVETDGFMLDVLAGARYLDLETDLDFDIGAIGGSFSGSGDIWDGIIGVNGYSSLSDTWNLTFHLDAGITGDTDSTWQALIGASRPWKQREVRFGYRYVEWDFDDNDPGGEVFDELDFSGPYGGIKFFF